MWQRYTLYDFRVIAHYLGDLIVLEAVGMLLPFIVGIICGEWEPASRYLFSVGITLTVGMVLRMMRIEPGHLNRQQAIAVTGFAWIALAVMAAIPLSLSENFSGYGDALFDTISYFTTTDVTIISNVDHLAAADNVWRFLICFTGGLGLVVVAMSIGMLGNSGSGSSLYASEGRSEHVVPNVVSTTRFILRFSLYVIGISGVVLSILLLFSGMAPIRAVAHGIWLSMSGFMTAGLAPMSTSITYYHNVLIEFVLMVVMILGGINFALHNEAVRGRAEMFFHDMEVHAAAFWWVIMLITFIMSMVTFNLSNSLTTLMRTGLFTFIAAATTTGFTVTTSNQLSVLIPSGALLVLTLTMAIGGSAGSTAGGIKLRRLAIIAKSAAETMKTAVSSDSARIVSSYFHVGRHLLSEAEVKEAMTVTIMFVSMYVIGTLAGIACGYDAVSSITESVAMASNSGISTGITSADMPVMLKVVYAIEMWAGRLEFVTLLALGVKIFVSMKPRIRGKRTQL